ncbi:MAG: hypothetical protein OEZ39_19460 [Gammaproteobacteria bacterium]|nr:hypothetical protein [Gammaproteobacteria bacterium]MDH5654044.1 hypothetical protein [Gammaproteobacteria bacterium]
MKQFAFAMGSKLANIRLNLPTLHRFLCGLLVAAGVSTYSAVAAAGSVNGELSILVSNLAKTPTITEERQYARIATDSFGNSVVVWQKKNTNSILEPVDSANGGIFGQLVSLDGVLSGSKFLVHRNAAGEQSRPDVAMDGSGNFIVVWVNNNSVSENIVYAQRYNADGTTNGSLITVSSATANASTPRIAADTAGNFVVTWREGSNTIHARLFASIGTPESPVITVNGAPAYVRSVPEIAMDASGNFTIVWVEGTSLSDGGDGSGRGVFGQRFNSVAGKSGGVFQVNTSTAGDQGFPQISMDSSGNFLVFWFGYSDDRNDLDILGQAFTAAGNKTGGEFHATGMPETMSIFSNYKAGSDSNGVTTLVWFSHIKNDGGDSYVNLRTIQINGTAVTTSYPIIPTAYAEFHVARNNSGRTTVVWEEERPDIKYYISALVNPDEYIPSANPAGSGGGCAMKKDSVFDPVLMGFVLLGFYYLLFARCRRVEEL